jgi:hypothetical protein
MPRIVWFLEFVKLEEWMFMKLSSFEPYVFIDGDLLGLEYSSILTFGSL